MIHIVLHNPFLIVVFILCALPCISCYTIANFRRIIKDIFVTNGYDRRVRPANMNDSVYLDVGLYFNGILYLTEVDQKMTSTGVFYIEWTDQGLMWDSYSYGGIDKINIPQNDIWKPDLVLQNGFETFQELGQSFNYVRVYNDGTVIWQPSQVFESRCSIDITYFPFDRQSCSLKFEVWSFDASEVKIQILEGVEFGDTFQEHSLWKVLSKTFEIDNENFYESRITFTFVLQRKPMYYVTSILLPVVLLGALIIVVFLIPAESGEKIGYSITVLLAMSVFLSIISTILPRNSDDVCLLAVYLLINVILGVVAVMLTAFQLRLLNREDDVLTKGFYSRLVLCCILGGKIKAKNNKISVSVNDQNTEIHDDDDRRPLLTWKDIVKALDYIFFLIFLIVYVITTMSVLVILVVYYFSQ